MRSILALTWSPFYVALALFASSISADAQELSLPVARDALVLFRPARADVHVTGWDRDSVRVTASKSGRVRIEMDRVTGGVQILERRPPGDTARPVYTLFVPRGAMVRVSTQAGILRFTGLRGVVHGGVVEGSVVADSIVGSVELSSVTGSVELRNTRGRIEARSVAGDVVLLGVAGSIRARTTSGDMRIELIERSAVKAESYSGRIIIRGALGGGPSSVATHSGDIQLELPPRGDITLFATSARVRVESCGTGLGPFDAARPAAIGAGGDPVDVLTFTGVVHIRCGQ